MDWGLGLHALNAEGVDSIPGPGARIPQAMRHCQKQKKERQKNETLYFTFIYFSLMLSLFKC